MGRGHGWGFIGRGGSWVGGIISRGTWMGRGFMGRECIDG